MQSNPYSSEGKLTDKSTITLLLGITFGLAVVGVIGFVLLVTRTQASTALPMQTYNNDESWSVVKDANGRVKNIVVHREAKQG